MSKHLTGTEANHITGVLEGLDVDELLRALQTATVDRRREAVGSDGFFNIGEEIILIKAEIKSRLA